MFPVFSLVLDLDVSPQIAMTFPELYKILSKVQINLYFYAVISLSDYYSIACICLLKFKLQLMLFMFLFCAESIVKFQNIFSLGFNQHLPR